MMPKFNIKMILAKIMIRMNHNFQIHKKIKKKN
jgi:hypothetical protein